MLRLLDSFYQQMNQIYEEGDGILWLGDFTAAQDRTLLDSKNITTVLTIATGLDIKYSEPGIIHKTYHIMDSENSNIAKLFPTTLIQIQEGLKRGSVLVHCAAGVSRSASIVIAYLMKIKGYNYNEAFNYVKKRRNVIQPNGGFIKQLKQYEKELKQPIKNQQQIKQNSFPNEQKQQIQSEKIGLDLNVVGQKAIKVQQHISIRNGSVGYRQKQQISLSTVKKPLQKNAIQPQLQIKNVKKQ